MDRGRATARLRAYALAAVVLLACLPVSAHAAVPRPPAPAPYRPLTPVRPVQTVDHPPADGVDTFDSGPRDIPKVALTFDADMTPGMLAQLRARQVATWYNAEVRDILDAERVPATIFMTGLWVTTYPDVARSLAADPLFEIGSHTYDHAAFRTPCYGLAPATDRAGELAQAQREIQAVIGVSPALLRFPGDCYDASDVALARAQGLTVISADVRGGDAFNVSAAAIASTVLHGAQPGSIVILHLSGGPNAPMTAPALRQIIAGLRQRGLGFATVSEILGRRPPPQAPKLLAALHPLSLLAPPLPRERRLPVAHRLLPPRPLLGTLARHLLP